MLTSIFKYPLILLKSIGEFITFIAQPLKVICFHKISFFLWMSFTLFGGLIGIVISVVRYTLFGTYKLSQAIYIESTNGSFYTYSIAIVASVLSGVFIIFAEKETLNFRRYQIPFITLSIFLMFFGGVFYALAKNTGSLIISEIPEPSQIEVDWKQLSIFAISVVFSIYSFCVCRIDDHRPYFNNVSDNRDKNKPVPPQITETANIGNGAS